MTRIDNIDLILAARDLLVLSMPDIVIYDVVHPVKELPDEFIIVRALSQADYGNVDVDGSIEVCIYVKNLELNGDQTQPNLARLNPLTKQAIATLFDAQNKGVFFNEINPTLVIDRDLGYFYNSLVIETKSINIKNY